MTRFNQGAMLFFLLRHGAPGDMQGVLRVRSGDGPFTPADYIGALRFMRRIATKGLVQVIKHPRDRRLFFTLTPAGFAKAEEFDLYWNRIEQARKRLEAALVALTAKAVPTVDGDHVPGAICRPPFPSQLRWRRESSSAPSVTRATP